MLGQDSVAGDQPHVVADANLVLDGAGVADRVTVVPGDCFETVPPGEPTPTSSFGYCTPGWMTRQCGSFATSERRWRLTLA